MFRARHIQRRLLTSATSSPGSSPSSQCSSGFSKNNGKIIQSFRDGNYESAILNFTRLPPHYRSASLYEAAISACAQVPDSTAALSLLNAMPNPTPSAFSATISALCRQHNPEGAAHIMETAVHGGRSDLINANLLLQVSRLAHRCKAHHISERLTRLSKYKPKPEYSETISSSAPTVQHKVTSGSHRTAESDQSSLAKLRPVSMNSAHAEQQIRRAVPDAQKVHETWLYFSSDPQLHSEAGFLSATISALSNCRSTPDSSSLPLNTLMTWVRKELFDPRTKQGHQHITSNRSSLALLLTSITTALSTCASTSPSLALSAYDALSALQIPGFNESLPLTGAYLKVLYHSNLPLDETYERILLAWKHHIQFDERAFSMALGAILKSDGDAPDRLNFAKEWLNIMKETGIPLTIYAYNLLARELQYGSADIRLGIQLLNDMKESGVNPTSQTYQYIFNACISGEDYTSWERKSSHKNNDVQAIDLWVNVLDGIRDQLHELQVQHSPLSSLALAKAYGHLGDIEASLEEFETYINLSLISNSIGTRSRYGGKGGGRKMYSSIGVNLSQDDSANNIHEHPTKGFHELMHIIAHARKCTNSNLDAITHIIHRMNTDFKLRPNGAALDTIIITLIRLGRIDEVVPMIQVWDHDRNGMTANGMKHLVQALNHNPDVKAWQTGVRETIVSNKLQLRRPEISTSVKSLIIQFARLGEEDVCNELMNASAIRVPNLHEIYEGRQFSAMRARRKENPVHGSDIEIGKTMGEQLPITSDLSEGESTERAAIEDRTAVPVT